MKVAIVHEWFTTYAGSERVVEQILDMYPNADIFTLVDFLEENERKFLKDAKVTTSFMQKLPFARKHFRKFLLLMPYAIEQFDLSGYDLIISSSHAVAKGIITNPDQIHVCYCHSPIRYAWDMQPQYLKQSGWDKGIKSIIARYMLHKIRLWDFASSARVDYFIANSAFIARRIKKFYRREAEVIFPPVDTNVGDLLDKEDFYVTASRMVPYKRIDLIVEAFSKMPDKKLIVIGDGPEEDRIKAKATGNNITFMGYLSTNKMMEYIKKAKAFVFAAEEDFGITPVEAQACGTPVIAYGKGGALETVVESKTGLFFKEQTVDSVIEAINKFEKMSIKSKDCVTHANSFSIAKFKEKFSTFVGDLKAY